MSTPQNSGNLDPLTGTYIDRNYPLNVQSFMQPFALNQQQICMQQQQQHQANEQRQNKFQLAPLPNPRDANNHSSDYHYEDEDF